MLDWVLAIQINSGIANHSEMPIPSYISTPSGLSNLTCFTLHWKSKFLRYVVC